MQSHRVSRRTAICQAAGLAAGAAFTGNALNAAEASASAGSTTKPGSFLFCLNTATIRGQKLGLIKEIEIAGKAGYQGIEPWLDTIEDYVKGGGSLKDAKKRLDDLGVSVESAIGFQQWAVDNDAKRAEALEQVKQAMDKLAQLGAKRLAAPPAGATELPLIPLLVAAERYRALLDLGDQMGVVPQLELWGFSKNLHRIGECTGAAIEAGHPKACVLLDVFHLYKSGSDFHGLKFLAGSMLQEIHMNDYPADPPQDKINDSFRIMPGDGIAPMVELLRLFRTPGQTKVLSLELFNRQYWEQDALEVAKLGLDKMKALVQKLDA